MVCYEAVYCGNAYFEHVERAERFRRLAVISIFVDGVDRERHFMARANTEECKAKAARYFEQNRPSRK